ncbi:MAG: hypothetical protein WKG01_28020 [Kofleriaceae bacterium]
MLDVVFAWALLGLPLSGILLVVAMVTDVKGLAIVASIALCVTVACMGVVAVGVAFGRRRSLEATRERAIAAGPVEHMAQAYRLGADGKLRAGWLALEAADLVFWADDPSGDVRLVRAEIVEASSVANRTTRTSPMLCVRTTTGRCEWLELEQVERWCGYVMSAAITSSSIS